MGFFSKIVGSFFGGAEKEAGGLQVDYNKKGIDEINKFNDQARKDIVRFADIGRGQLELADRGAAPSLYGQNLADLEAGLAPLIDIRRRSVNDSLSRSGLTRSGAALKEAANVPYDLLAEIENRLFGRQSGLASLGAASASNLGALGAQAGSSIASLLNASGQAAASAKVGSSNKLGSTLGAIGGIVKGIFSDDRLKKNKIKVGEIGNLNVYEWEWAEWVPDEMQQMNIGFIAQDVEEKYPEFVITENGIKSINYYGLIEKLRVN